MKEKITNDEWRDFLISIIGKKLYIGSPSVGDLYSPTDIVIKTVYKDYILVEDIKYGNFYIPINAILWIGARY